MRFELVFACRSTNTLASREQQHPLTLFFLCKYRPHLLSLQMDNSRSPATAITALTQSDSERVAASASVRKGRYLPTTQTAGGKPTLCCTHFVLEETNAGVAFVCVTACDLYPDTLQCLTKSCNLPLMAICTLNTWNT